jgi:hypothetical protein
MLPNAISLTSSLAPTLLTAFVRCSSRWMPTSAQQYWSTPTPPTSTHPPISTHATYQRLGREKGYLEKNDPKLIFFKNF